MTDPTSRANNPQMGDDFAAVYEATAHRITGPVSNTALDIVGVGPGTRIIDIAAGAGALSGPAAERGAAVLATDIAPGMVRRLAERLRPFHRCEAREMDGEALAVPDASFDAAFSIFGVMLLQTGAEVCGSRPVCFAPEARLASPPGRAARRRPIYRHGRSAPLGLSWCQPASAPLGHARPVRR